MWVTIFVAGEATDFFDSIVTFQVGEAGALIVENFFGKVYDIVALIAIGGKLDILAQSFQVAGVYRSVEEVHLGAGVVNVVFAGDLVAGGLEDGGEDAAKDGAAGVADVDGAGGVDADEFDHDLAGVGGWKGAEVVAGVEDFGHLLLEPLGTEAKVEEAGRGDPDLLDQAVGGDEVGEGFGDMNGGQADGAGEAEGQAGGEVAVLRVARTLDFDDGHGVEGKEALATSGLQGPFDFGDNEVSGEG